MDDYYTNGKSQVRSLGLGLGLRRPAAVTCSIQSPSPTTATSAPGVAVEGTTTTMRATLGSQAVQCRVRLLAVALAEKQEPSSSAGSRVHGGCSFTPGLGAAVGLMEAWAIPGGGRAGGSGGSENIFLLIQLASETSTGRPVVARYGRQWPARVAHRGGLTLAILAPPALHTAAAAEDSSVGARLARCPGYVEGGFA